MVRNIPAMYTQDMLLQEWSNDGTYDFLYLPFNCAMNKNLSYAFVNFVSQADALAFMARWQKKRLARFSSKKPLNISFAAVQGRDNNLRQSKKKRVRRIRQQGQPIVFEQGERVPLTAALAALGD